MAHGLEIWSPLDYGIKHQPLMYKANEVNAKMADIEAQLAHKDKIIEVLAEELSTRRCAMCNYQTCYTKKHFIDRAKAKVE